MSNYKWTKVSERLPEENTRVLVTLVDSDGKFPYVDEARYAMNGDVLDFIIWDDYYLEDFGVNDIKYLKVVAWMIYPSPYDENTD